ncbi:CBS domain-containing protein [Devosia sp.]|uniref:CBS domain-containing protein n=1 Tax=Devosia sp. TaxID=1871048 RepID=UPI002AFDCD8B|nr:CBS domain-containing protein [Devosia sp.]
MLVETILNTKGVVVHTLPDSATLADAVAALNAHNVGALVITDQDGAIAGILSERDIVRRLGRDAAATLSLAIAECMTRSVVTASRDTPVSEVMERMTRFRIRHMPVAEDGQLVGIVSIGDVVKCQIEAAQREAEALREYIAG